MILTLLKKKDKILSQCENAQLSEEQKREMEELIEERAAILEG